MAPRKGKVQKEEPVIQLGPQIQEGELVYGVAHIFASFNDTFVHVTDLSGRYTLFYIFLLCSIIYMLRTKWHIAVYAQTHLYVATVIWPNL